MILTPEQQRERDILIAQLFAARAQLDAMLAVLGVPEEGADLTARECPHPGELREDLREMGGPLEWRCRGCWFHSITN